MKEEGRNEEPEDLRERTLEFGLRVIKMFGLLPKTDEARTIGRQVLRSGTSIGSNYREARRARSKAEFIAIAGICLKEADETSYWLEMLVRSGIVTEPKLKPLRDECDELIAIFVAIIKKAKGGEG
jgi:four helix bundle protein